MKTDLLLDIILLILNIFSFLFGLILGRLLSNSSVSYNVEKPKSFLDQTSEKNKIVIDDKKIVLNIKTDDIEKKYDNLGDVKHSSENITSSVDKLKQMKKG